MRLNGLETSSNPDTSRPETLTSDPSVDVARRRFARPIPNVIFFAGIGGWSRALRLAGWPDDRPVWTGSCPCQPFSPRRLSRLDTQTSGTFGRLGLGSSRSDALQSSLGEQVASASKWLRLVRGDLEALVYAVGAIPIEARERRCGPSSGPILVSWPTPTTRDHKDGGVLPERAGEWCCWGRMVWPTPTACADKSIRTPEGARTEVARGRSPDLAAVAMATWPTARANDGNGAKVPPGRMGGPALKTSRLDWVIGADGKARRVKPGIRLLAHGVPARVGKLRAFGNAIDPMAGRKIHRCCHDAIPVPSG